MSIFKNDVLAEIDGMVQPQFGKVKQVMLFTLIDGYLNGELEDTDFLQNLKAMFGVKE
jgi:hypothetical protein